MGMWAGLQLWRMAMSFMFMSDFMFIFIIDGLGLQFMLMGRFIESSPICGELHIIGPLMEVGGARCGLRLMALFRLMLRSELPLLIVHGTLLRGLAIGEPDMLLVLHAFIGRFEGLPMGELQFWLLMLCGPIIDMGLPF